MRASTALTSSTTSSSTAFMSMITICDAFTWSACWGAKPSSRARKGPVCFAAPAAE